MRLRHPAMHATHHHTPSLGGDPVCLAVLVIDAVAAERGLRTHRRQLGTGRTALGWRLIPLPNQEVPHACTSR